MDTKSAKGVFSLTYTLLGYTLQELEWYKALNIQGKFQAATFEYALIHIAVSYRAKG